MILFSVALINEWQTSSKLAMKIVGVIWISLNSGLNENNSIELGRELAGEKKIELEICTS